MKLSLRILKVRIKLTIIFFLFGLVCIIIFSTGCKDNLLIPQEKFYEGRIVMVGNMPFSKPALMINGTEIIRMECPAYMEKIFIQSQGYFFRVYYYYHHTPSNIIIVTRYERL